MTDRMAEPLAKALGTRSAGPLAKLGLHTVGDLLRHYPRRYGDPGTLTDLAGLALGEHVTIVAQVRSATVRRMRSRPGAILEAVVTDGPHQLSLTFFAKGPGALRYHEQRLAPGRDSGTESGGAIPSWLRRQVAICSLSQIRGNLTVTAGRICSFGD